MSQPTGILDLVQLRWQLIRSVDSTQSIQKENIELKQEIAQLKFKLKNASTEKSGVKSEIIDKFKMHFDSYIMKDKAELVRMKQYMMSEQQEFASMKLMLQRVVKQYHTMMLEKDNRIEQLKEEYGASSKDISQIRKEMMQQQIKFEEDTKRIKSLNDTQKQEIDRLNAIIAKNVEDLKSLHELNDELRDQNSSFGRTLLEMEKHNAALRHDYNNFQDQSRQALHEAQESQQRMSEHYERMIEEMGLENQYLRTHVKELEDQIARLSNALVGNKSHFAKYVEVKTENMVLQTKLDAVMKKNPRYKEKLLSTNEPQAHLLADSNGLPQIHAPNNQRKPIIPAGEKGRVVI